MFAVLIAVERNTKEQAVMHNTYNRNEKHQSKHTSPDSNIGLKQNKQNNRTTNNREGLGTLDNKMKGWVLEQVANFNVAEEQPHHNY